MDNMWFSILLVAVGLLFGLILAFVVNSLRVSKAAKEAEKEMCSYETAFCRDVRASLGMFAYPSKLEETRQKLNRANSKF